MSTLKYIRGLSRAGFRVPGSPPLHIKQGTNSQVDIDDHATELVLAGNRNTGAFIRVATSGSTTATVNALSRRGFRIPRSSDSAWVQAVVGGFWIGGSETTGPVTVDLTDPKVQRILLRNKRDWFFAADPTALVIRGIQNEQNGFDVHGTATGTLTSTNVTPTDGDTVTVSNGGTWAESATDINVETASVTYTLKTALTETHATAQLNSDGTAPTAGETVTVNNVTYRFESALAQANDVKIGASSDATLTSLAKAINQNGSVGTDYYTGTVAPTGVTSGTLQGTGATGHLIFTATALGTGGNAFHATETSAHLSYTGGTGFFTGGLNAIANQILIGGSADAALTNLKYAVNGTGGTAGTNYSTGTTTLGNVYLVTGPTSHVLTFTAVAGGVDYPVSTVNAGPTLTWSASELMGGVTKVYRGVSVTIDATKAFNFQQLRRHYDCWIEG